MGRNEIKQCSTKDMVGYSTGEIANSLVTNGISGFAMLYYTDALGLPHTWAGWAMALSIFWDAITDPVMGHISDNTRSRFGRRHPYILAGGIVMAIAYLFIWMVPKAFQSSDISLFWYLVAMNLFLRTAYTVYLVPLTALGFEMCQDYTGRTKLQSIRQITTMLANISGPALAWSIFFKERGATAIVGNYLRMGSVFFAAILLSVLFMVFVTHKYSVDSRHMKISGARPKDFFKDVIGVIMDRYSRWVFAYTLVILLGIGLVGGLQMYLYEHFMKFDGLEKTVTHGGTMLGYIIGSSIAISLSARMEKKSMVYLAGSISIFSCIMMIALFCSGILHPGQAVALAGLNLPLAMPGFAIFNAGFWVGIGMQSPISLSMIADVSELNKIDTGISKEGEYAAVFSFCVKLSLSISSLLVGYCLMFSGFVSGQGVEQSHATTTKLLAITFIAGSTLTLLAMLLMRKYPVDEVFLLQKREGQTKS